MAGPTPLEKWPADDLGPRVTRGTKNPRAIAWFGFSAFWGHLRHFIASAIATDNIDSRQWMIPEAPDVLLGRVLEIIGPRATRHSAKEMAQREGTLVEAMGGECWIDFVSDCGDDVTVSEAVAQLFVRETFPPDAKARVEELVNHLLAAMGRAIRGNTWMTEATRTQALTKLAGFSYKIGYPDEWRDYTSLAIDRTSFLANRLAASAFELRRQLGRLGSPVDKGEWAMPAHVVNAYYHPLRNEIVFPAGILQPPYFHAHADDAVNHGGIGTIIGHEITHGFDDTGSRFDAGGALRDWWTEEDRTEFERRAAVLAEQFDEFTVAEGVTVNGRLTLGENIADLGGLAISLDALHEAIGPDAPTIDALTPDQRFFLAYATMWRMGYTEAAARMLAKVDVHSPARHRVNGPLANTPAFAAAFGIPQGAPMALPADRRATIW